MIMVSPRSTKGASKARRDHINHEIRNMRSLLPVGQEDQERLSYLHSMAAICTYIRKSVLLQGEPPPPSSSEILCALLLSCSSSNPSNSPPEGLASGGRSRSGLPYQAFLQALGGFILVTTAQGRLVYVSENVSDYLGLSMVSRVDGRVGGSQSNRLNLKSRTCGFFSR